MVMGIDKLFPGLVGKTYQFTSPADEVYNCIAWAAGRKSEWWWPFDAPGHYWPEGVAKAETLHAFQDVFATIGYTVCNDAEFDAGFEKVAIFADANGIPTHASRQLPNGRWTSKLGKLEDIEHDLLDLTGVEYGSVVVIMQRPKP
jgi:hypothetical protein